MRYFKYPMILIVVALLTFSACDDDLLNSGTTNTFHLQGLVVVDQNLSQRTISANLWRNDTLFSEALILADDNVVWYTQPNTMDDSAYYRADTTSAWLLADNLPLSIIDSNVTHSTNAIVPDTFSILTLSPPNHRVSGLSDPVTLSWSGSAGTESYILAAVKTSSAYTGVGYAIPVATLSTGGTIPPDAFQLAGSPSPDTGLYNIYVYAMTGTPDSVLASELLPTPIPVQLAANINEVRFSGWMGSVRVVYRDTVRVFTNP